MTEPSRQHRLSLAHLTLIDAHPLELVEAGAAGGFDSIGLRIVAPFPTDRIVDVIGDAALQRDIARRLADHGMDILDVEAVWLSPTSDVESLRGAFETAGRLGARYFLVVGNDPDAARLTDNFARFCELARPHGIRAMLEFIPYSEVRTLGAAHDLVRRSGAPNAGVLVDALHLSRSGGSAADLAGIDPALFSYCQLCDAPAARPDAAGLRPEAREGRLYPALGELPLEDMMRALPPGIPVGVEAPCREFAHLSPVERGRLAGVATRAFIHTIQQRAATARQTPST